MKRFHVHLHVDDLARNIGFYSRLFAREPARAESDCTPQANTPARCC